ncbi:restriction endonuclease subunit S [Spongiactinospora sp. TRM90649]|uniref:restriction endonuclease subunit S n=1 Tax=Spongiactinospora sp. TRM90649 TaxID=3031114 RepID=UPI0023F84011|nr:restriction endonuclease subunit S [Spongiactinospora sp. TRM90649]MDF5759062.1 restriction endonuclease subunit S [Spongiactinospora sp. TRM90649]
MIEFMKAFANMSRVKHLVSKIGSGKTPMGGSETYPEEGVVFLRSQNIHFGGLRLEDVAYISEETHREMENTRLVEGDVLLNITGASIGRVARFPKGIGEANVNQHVCILRPTSSVDSRFLEYALSAYTTWAQILSLQAGGNRDGLNFEQVGDLHIPTPAIDTQRRIANFLDAETARIDRLSMLRSHQIQLILSRTISALSGVYEVCVVKYGAIRLRYTLMSIEQGWSPQCDDRLAEDGEWAVVKAGCVNTGIFDPLQHKALPSETAPRQEYRLYPGDLLMSRASGSRDLIGSAGIVGDYEGNLLLCDKVYRIRLNETRMRPGFVANMLRSHRVREHIKNGISGADGMANNLPTGVVKNCELPNVPVNRQDEIALSLERAAEESRRARSMLERSRGLLAEYRQALITAAVTGQFDVSSASGREVE